jgi:hypothetical protein
MSEHLGAKKWTVVPRLALCPLWPLWSDKADLLLEGLGSPTERWLFKANKIVSTSLEALT